ncbi:MAG: hypothetical protein M1813_006228 [Trichoglossum hirsutum]|nr:MAG: hypothetical protein M1813_006228 [Trichoglossum hirsutum]
MHKLRSQARKHSLNAEANNPYNPFSRTRFQKRRQAPDLESCIPSEPADGLSNHTDDIKQSQQRVEIQQTRETRQAQETQRAQQTRDSSTTLSKTKHVPISRQIRAVFCGGWVRIWVNSLFLFSPAGFAVKYTHQNSATTFSVNFIAVIPSAALLAYAIEELILYLGDKVGGLVSMTFSNAVQLITSVLLLKSRQIKILRISLLGSILSNLLLMTGLGFLFGGIGRLVQSFNAAVTQTIIMLLLLAVLSLVVPTASHLMTAASDSGILAQSRGTCVIVITSYGLWLLFQLKTNRSMFNEPSGVSAKAKTCKIGRGEVKQMVAKVGADAIVPVGGTAIAGQKLMHELALEEERIEPSLSFPGALVTTTVATALISFHALFATDSIQSLLQEAGLSQSFVGIVILPILNSDPTSIVIAMKDRMDMSISLTLEKCMQTTLMVIPLIVLLAWCMGIDEMTLEFDGFLIIVTYVVRGGESNRQITHGIRIYVSMDKAGL